VSGGLIPANFGERRVETVLGSERRRRDDLKRRARKASRDFCRKTFGDLGELGVETLPGSLR